MTAGDEGKPGGVGGGGGDGGCSPCCRNGGEGPDGTPVLRPAKPLYGPERMRPTAGMYLAETGILKGVSPERLSNGVI